MPTRVYVPASAADLRRLSREGHLGSTPLDAYAVTSTLRREHPGVDEEELEYLALVDAAGTGRVTVAADVEHDTVQERDTDALASAVRLTHGVALRQVASFHVPGDPGPTGAPELSWYDATELPVVLEALPGQHG